MKKVIFDKEYIGFEDLPCLIEDIQWEFESNENFQGEFKGTVEVKITYSDHVEEKQ